MNTTSSTNPSSLPWENPSIATTIITRPPLLPAAALNPSLLWWIAALPQALLLFLNLRNYLIISGDMSSAQTTRALLLFGTQVLLFAASITLVLRLQSQRKSVSSLHALFLFLAPASWLAFATWTLGNHPGIIPDVASAWILPLDRVFLHQYTFMMPPIAYGIVRLSCFPWQVTRAIDIAVCVTAGIGTPFLLWVTAQLNVPFPSESLVVPGLFIATALLLGALTRLLVTAFAAARNRGPIAMAILVFVVALAAPIAGLLLNQKIPFPADFQSFTVYALTITNGLILLLPNIGSPRTRRAVWLAQCLLFPFTAYFFLVFLPYLPLSVLATLVAGAGFLVLAPTALFMIHTQKLVSGFRQESQHSTRRHAALLTLAAISLIPLGFTTRALYQRHTLHQALDYVYTPDYQAPQEFPGHRPLLRSTLLALRDFKAGLELPYLSEAYNEIVFGGLVLPEKKLQHLHEAFFGAPLPAPHPGMGIFANNGRRRTLTEAPPRTINPFSHDVSLTKIEQFHDSEDGCGLTRLELTMENNTAAQSEFVTQLQLPEGVLVSGFWLDIEGERVPGRLFEKKAAHWVYQQIRDVSRCDPAILTYQSPTQLELRVFPFSSHQTRSLELELLYPESLQPTVHIGNHFLDLPGSPGDSARIPIAAQGNTAAVAIPPDIAHTFPALPRKPYLHFIIDRSLDSPFDQAATLAAIDQAAHSLNAAESCMITFANYESADLYPEPVSLAKARHRLKTWHQFKSLLPQRGGFLPEHAMKRALVQYQHHLNRARLDKDWMHSYPVFVVLGGSTDHALTGDKDLAQLLDDVPDRSGLYQKFSPARPLESLTFGKGELALAPVALLRVNGACRLCPTEFAPGTQTELIVFNTPGDITQPTLEVYHPAQKQFFPVTGTTPLPNQSRYAKGVAAIGSHIARRENPATNEAGLNAAVDASKETGILTPDTSYIVVEAQSQWEALKLAEKKKLKNHVALEISTVPEPTTPLLLLTAASITLLSRRRPSR